VLPRRLREMREAKGLTQRELGRRCGFGVNQINRYENGTSDPTIQTLRIIAYELGVSADYLLGLTDDPQGTTIPDEIKPEEREILDVYRRDGWVGVIRLVAEKLSK
jgi:transcriptional regulator with XRE-family HTH domain